MLLLIIFCSIGVAACSAHGAQPRPPSRTQSLPVAPGTREFRRRNEQDCGRFRSLDGTCTNLGTGCGNKMWGSAGTAHFSYVPGHSSTFPVRGDLPSARQISNVISAQSDPIFNRRGITEFFVFFGEFLDHNIIATAINEHDNFDIPLPKNDPLHTNFTDGVLRFTRTERVRAIGEDAERAMNTVSSAIDLNTVYGPSNDRLRDLRTFSGGKLKTSRGDFMPFNTPGLHNEPSESPDFFLAGDIRANDHPVLTSLHTIFLREHNYWCERIAAVQPSLSDERIFQRARKINIAQMQKIVYEEFFPAITGRLLPAYKGHNPCVNPSISDVFSTAAYRIGHTLVGNNVQRRGPGMSPLPSLDFTQMFFSPAQTFLRNGMESFLRGAIDTPAQEVDTLVSTSLRNFLFANVHEFRHMVDLIAINIQRGRDNALPDYNGIRRMFRLRPARRFADITSSITVQSQLSTLYTSPDDVDPWIGLMAEDHAPGASMGPTLRRIWHTEFTRLRDGDRFFYQNENHFTSLTLQRFPELRDIATKRAETMKKLILRHTNINPRDLQGPLFRNPQKLRNRSSL